MVQFFTPQWFGYTGSVFLQRSTFNERETNKSWWLDYCSRLQSNCPYTWPNNLWIRNPSFLSTCDRRLGAAGIVHCDCCPKAQKKVFETENGYPSPQTQSVTALVCSCKLGVEKHEMYCLSLHPFVFKGERCAMEEFIHVPVNLSQALLDLLAFAKRMTEMTEEN